MKIQARVATVLAPRLVVAALVGVALVAAAPAGGSADPSIPSVSAPSPAQSAGPAATRWLTLVTGDRVAYREVGDQVEVVGVLPVDGSSGMFRTVAYDDHLRVVPAEAQPYVDDGTIDPRLFDVTLLADSDAPTSLTIRDGDSIREETIPSDPSAARTQWRALIRSDVRQVELQNAPSDPARTTEATAADPSTPCTRGDNPNEPAPDKTPVTISGLDRRGEPVGGHFLLQAYHCQPWESYGYIDFGAGVDGRTFYLPAGSYSLMGDITTRDRSGRFPQEVTVGGDLQIDLAEGDTEPRQIVVDARDAVPLDAATPLPAQAELAVLGWTRGADDHRLLTSLILSPQYSSVSRMSVIPAEPIRDGEFDFYPTFRMSTPVARASGGGLPELDPKLLPGNPLTPFDRRLRLADASRPCQGCAVLVQEDESGGIAGPVQAALDGGAGAVLVMPAEPGIVYGSVAAPDVPVFGLSYDEGEALRHRLHSWHPSIRIQVTPRPPYLYDLAMHESDGLPDDLRYEFSSHNLRRIEQRFHGDGASSTMYETRFPLEPCRCSLTPVFSQIATGTTRVDYVSDNGSVWQQQLFRPGLTLRDEGQPYSHDTPRVVDWLAGPLVPGLTRGLTLDHSRFPALSQDGSLVFRVPPMVDGAGHGGSLGTATGRLLRDGEVVADLSFGGFVTVPAGDQPATWRLELEHSHPASGWATATSGSVAWTFRAGGDVDPEPTALPLIDARIDLPLALDGGRTHGPARIAVEPWRLDGQRLRIDRIRLEISTDEGATWSDVRLRRAGRDYRATLPRRTEGPVSLRLLVADRDGSMLERTVHNAWTQ